MPGRTRRRPKIAHAVVFVWKTSRSGSFFFKMHCSSFYCFSGAGSKLWCVAYMMLFIWYEKFRTCVISPSDPPRQISKCILLVCFVTPELFSFYFSDAMRAGVSCAGTSHVHRSSMWINQHKSRHYARPHSFSFTLFVTSPSSSSAPTWAASLLLTASANSKTISGVEKTTARMIYSLLILKTSVLSRGFVWALLSDF